MRKFRSSKKPHLRARRHREERSIDFCEHWAQVTSWLSFAAASITEGSVEILNVNNVNTVNTEYGLHMSADIEKQMRRCRAPVRAAINQHLREIAAGAGKAKTKHKPKNKVLSPKEPPLRFYVYEGYR